MMAWLTNPIHPSTMTSQISARLLPGYQELVNSKQAASPTGIASTSGSASTSIQSSIGLPPTSINLVSHRHFNKRCSTDNDFSARKRAKLHEDLYDASQALQVLHQADFAIPAVQLRDDIDYSRVSIIPASQYDSMQPETRAVPTMASEWQSLAAACKSHYVPTLAKTVSDNGNSSESSTTSSVTDTSTDDEEQDRLSDEEEDFVNLMTPDMDDYTARARLIVLNEDDYDIVHTNQSLSRLTGLCQARLQGRSLLTLIKDKDGLTKALQNLEGSTKLILANQSVRLRSDRQKFLDDCTLRISTVGTSQTVTHFALEIEGPAEDASSSTPLVVDEEMEAYQAIVG